MQISLVKTQATKIALVPPPDEARDLQDEFAFSVTTRIPAEPAPRFDILFSIKLEDQNFDLEVEFLAIFQTDEPVKPEFAESPFAKINAPAIAYPYLRSFISTITLNAGYEPLLIPTVNFVALVQQKQAEQQGSTGQ